jgi:hypothetical protein
MPVLAIAVPALWVTAALAAGWLPHASTAAALRRRTLLTLTSAAAAGIAGLLDAPPLLTILAILVAALSMPRLVRVRAAARGVAAADPEIPAPPALRAAAAHPSVVVPIQATAYVAAVVFALSTVFAPAAAATLFGGLALATAVTVGWHATRHRRLRASALVLGPGPRAPIRL